MICAIGVKTGGLRERILLGAQIAAEDRRTRRGDRLQTLLRPERNSASADALQIDRGRLTFTVAERYRPFPGPWQSHPILAPFTTMRNQNLLSARRVTAGFVTPTATKGCAAALVLSPRSSRQPPPGGGADASPGIAST